MIETDITLIESKNDYNKYVIDTIRSTVNVALITGEYEELTKLLSLYDNKEFIMTSFTFRFLNILKFYLAEVSAREKSFLFTSSATVDELMNNYLYIILMLRRIELFSDDSFSEEAFTFFKSNNICPNALSIIIKEEYFEKRKKLLLSIYDRISSAFTDDVKVEWLLCLYKEFEIEEAQIEIAQLFLKYNDFLNAKRALEKVNNNPKAKEYLQQIEELLNGC